MIFVTVGTHHQPFDRLISAVDALAESIDEPVIVQRGSSSLRLKYAHSFDFASSSQMTELSRDARVIVAHAGEGTIMLAIKEKKRLVLVPRLRRFGEHIDDHQLQLARALESTGRAVVVKDVTAASLRRAIARAQMPGPSPVQNADLVSFLRDQLEVWSAQRQRTPNVIVNGERQK